MDWTLGDWLILLGMIGLLIFLNYINGARIKR